jgi:hypothetical protein
MFKPAPPHRETQGLVLALVAFPSSLCPQLCSSWTQLVVIFTVTDPLLPEQEGHDAMGDRHRAGTQAEPPTTGCLTSRHSPSHFCPSFSGGHLSPKATCLF